MNSMISKLYNVFQDVFLLMNLTTIDCAAHRCDLTQLAVVVPPSIMLTIREGLFVSLAVNVIHQKDAVPATKIVATIVESAARSGRCCENLLRRASAVGLTKNKESQ